MQANQQEAYEQVHQVVQSTVEKMYNRIDAIIQSAKAFVEQSPERGDRTVEGVTQYTRFMHRVIDKIVDEYQKLLDTNGDINSFKQTMFKLLEKAKDATQKIQGLIA